MRAIMKLPFVAGLLLITPSFAIAMPNRESEKDYLRKPKMPSAWDKTFIPFEKHDEPWERVLLWFADETGHRIRFHNQPPSGTFTFVNPGIQWGVPRMYSLLEVFDIINEVLQGSAKHALLRRGHEFVLIAADESFHNWQFPRVELKDLPNYGRTEIVVVEVKLDQDAELVAGQIKKLLGDFGHVTVIGNNQIRVRGTVQSLMLALEL